MRPLCKVHRGKLTFHQSEFKLQNSPNNQFQKLRQSRSSADIQRPTIMRPSLSQRHKANMLLPIQPTSYDFKYVNEPDPTLWKPNRKLLSFSPDKLSNKNMDKKRGHSSNSLSDALQRCLINGSPVRQYNNSIINPHVSQFYSTHCRRTKTLKQTKSASDLNIELPEEGKKFKDAVIRFYKSSIFKQSKHPEKILEEKQSQEVKQEAQKKEAETKEKIRIKEAAEKALQNAQAKNKQQVEKNEQIQKQRLWSSRKTRQVQKPQQVENKIKMDQNVELYIRKLKKTIPKIKITDEKSETKLTSYELDQMFQNLEKPDINEYTDHQRGFGSVSVVEYKFPRNKKQVDVRFTNPKIVQKSTKKNKGKSKERSKKNLSIQPQQKQEQPFEMYKRSQSPWSYIQGFKDFQVDKSLRPLSPQL